MIVKKNVLPGTKARMYCDMISMYPNSQGGMRFTFPPYGRLMGLPRGYLMQE
jgi:hypothetical protein